MKSSCIVIRTFSVMLGVVILGSALPALAQNGSPAAPPADQQAAEAAGAPAGTDAPQAALGTTFTYQGSLKKSDQPVNTTCSFQFSLWDALTGGAYSLVSAIGRPEPGTAAPAPPPSGASRCICRWCGDSRNAC